MMPPQLAPIGDAVIWQAILSQGLTHAHNPRPTVAYRSQYQIHYTQVGECPPPNTKPNAESIGKAYGWWQALPQKERNDWLKYFASD